MMNSKFHIVIVYMNLSPKQCFEIYRRLGDRTYTARDLRNNSTVVLKRYKDPSVARRHFKLLQDIKTCPNTRVVHPASHRLHEVHEIYGWKTIDHETLLDHPSVVAMTYHSPSHSPKDIYKLDEKNVAKNMLGIIKSINDLHNCSNVVIRHVHQDSFVFSEHGPVLIDLESALFLDNSSEDKPNSVEQIGKMIYSSAHGFDGNSWERDDYERLAELWIDIENEQMSMEEIADRLNQVIKSSRAPNRRNTQ